MFQLPSVKVLPLNVSVTTTNLWIIVSQKVEEKINWGYEALLILMFLKATKWWEVNYHKFGGRVMPYQLFKALT